MKIKNITNILSRDCCLILSALLYSQFIFSQSIKPVAISLTNLDAFRNPGKNWLIGSDASADFSKTGPIKIESGSGIVAVMPLKNGSDLITKEDFGNLDLKLDFMLAKGAISEVYLQGRYGIKLADSWTKLDPTHTDLGSIGQKSSGSSEFNGNAPLMNVARAPGLWQHLSVKFIAPKFDANGVKISNAYFDEIYLNNVLVQAHIEVNGPTQGSMFSDEKTNGPLILRQNEGSIAFRNIYAGTFTEPQPSTISIDKPNDRRSMRVVNPIFLNPEGEPYAFRSFLNFEGIKRTYVVSVGNPNQTNYSYDVKQGALLQIWRGKFLDVTNMWDSRGEPQLAIPLGSVLSLSAAPTFATLANENTLWPDSIAFDDMHNKGYTLDKDRIPTFRYEVAGYNVSDKISPNPNGESLIRELTVTGVPKDLYCRIATAKKIEPLGKGLYAIDGKCYYILIDESFKASVRKTPNGQELIVAVTNTPSSLTYSIIW